MTRSARIGCVGLVLGTLLACGGSGPEGPAPAWTAVDGLTGRSCHYAMPPDATPSFRDLARIGTRGNLALWGRDLGSADSVTLSVRYDDEGRLQWVQAIASNLSPDRSVALEQLVLESLDDTAREDWGVRVLVVGGDVVDVAPSVLCEPEEQGGPGIWADIPATSEVYGDFYRMRGRRIPVRVTLDELGRLMDAQLVQTTYSRWADQYILDYVRNLSFEPKLHDGIGVASMFQLRIHFPRR